MRMIIVAVAVTLLAGEAQAYCYPPPAFSSQLDDQVAYLACIIDEQNKTIGELNSQIDSLSSSVSTLADKVDDLARK